MTTLKSLKWQLERCERTMQRTKPIWEKPNQTPGPFETGRSNYSRAMSKRLDAENERKGKAFNEYEAARKEHERLTQLIKDVEAGERHPNGQQCADAPSRLKRETSRQQLEEALYPFLKAHLQPGQQAGTMYGGTFTVRRINRKSVTSTQIYAGEIVKYELAEVRLLDADGKPTPASEMAKRLTEWMQKEQS